MSVLFGFYAIEYIPLVEANLILNLAPLFVALIAYRFMNEVLNKFDIFCLFIAIVGIILMVVGSPDENSTLDSSKS